VGGGPGQPRGEAPGRDRPPGQPHLAATKDATGHGWGDQRYRACGYGVTARQAPFGCPTGGATAWENAPGGCETPGEAGKTASRCAGGPLTAWIGGMERPGEGGSRTRALRPAGLVDVAGRRGAPLPRDALVACRAATTRRGSTNHLRLRYATRCGQRCPTWPVRASGSTPGSSKAIRSGIEAPPGSDARTWSSLRGRRRQQARDRTALASHRTAVTSLDEGVVA
jgi:hypothetical protein